MNQHHVDLEHAKLLKESGWDKPTELIWAIVNWRGLIPEWGIEPMATATSARWYPAPNLSELLDEIPFTNLLNYYAVIITLWDYFPEWLYETMKDPNALVDVWLWVKGMTKNERQRILKAIKYFLDDDPDKWVDGIDELFLLVHSKKWSEGLDNLRYVSLKSLIRRDRIKEGKG